ncbi:hypothetical protein DLM85_07050 [Hymenobacter edaphi]|uniref:Gliding motility-associated C-terminal domain-containing protein n=1 Tax=Hymenobacter edaphi TaxID=2211146 RepID=A0A328BTG8_9BACT|nr:hypothetical protein DLM85_07050 [Hymenobacter edaphi]
MWLLAAPAWAQTFTKKWDRTYGGPSGDDVSVMLRTADGGFLLAGSSLSWSGFDRTEPSRGQFDYWLVKTDSLGVKQWDKALGGVTDDDLTALAATPDGGFLVGGHTDTRYAPFGDISEASRGEDDFWVVKLNARGDKVWDHRYGGRHDDYLTDILPTPDGGFLLTGLSNSPSSGEKTTASFDNVVPGRGDYWVVKIDASGRRLWDRSYGGPQEDASVRLLATPDGGYLLGGTSSSPASGTKTAPLRGQRDYWLIKFDAGFAQQWQATYGAPGADSGLANLSLGADGSALLVGRSNGNRGGNKSEDSRGGLDYWLVNINPATGAVNWDRTVGSPSDDYATAALGLPGGGWLVSGSNRGAGRESTAPRRGASDMWLVRLRADGQLQDNYCVGGSGDELAGRTGTLAAVGAGEYVLAARSYSEVSGDKSEPTRGNSFDMWLIRLGLPQISGDALLCHGATTVLRGPAGATTYRWSTGATTASISVTQPGLYTLTCTFPGGAVVTFQHTVQPFITPPIRIRGDSLLCADGVVQLDATTPNATGYRWSTGATTPAIAVSQPGQYSVQVYFGSTCRAAAAQRVRLLPRGPAFGFGPDTTLCEGGSLLLRGPAAGALPPGTTYRWSDGSTQATLPVSEPGLYTLQLTAPDWCQQLSRRVDFRACIVIPNIITPNGDDLNDRFVVRGLPAGPWELQVFTRWGQQVYHTNDYTGQWGSGAAAGVYFYRLRHSTSGALYKGWVEVVR